MSESSDTDVTEFDSEDLSDTPGAEEGPMTFDPAVAAEHQYLGEMNSAGWIEPDTESPDSVIPLLPLEGVILFPSQTLPLTLSRWQAGIAERILAREERAQSLGIVRLTYDGQDVSVANIGTAAQLVSVRSLRDGGMHLIAKGRHRFRILAVHNDPSGLRASVAVLKDEHGPTFPPSQMLHCKTGYPARLLSLPPQITADLALPSPTLRRKVLSGCRSLTSHPVWVMRAFDLVELAQRGKQLVTEILCGQFSAAPDDEAHLFMPSDPRVFAWWLPANLPVSDENRQALLEIDSSVVRLRDCIRLLYEFNSLRCVGCHADIATRDEMYYYA